MSVAAGFVAEAQETERQDATPQGFQAPQGPDEGPSPEQIQVPVLENVDRAVTGLITGAPPLLLVLVGWQLWNRELHWLDIAIFLIMYVPTGLGVTVGFHRLLTHRSFRTSPWLRGLLGVLGTMAVEGPVISWVADHRKHHAYSDRLGDPHSPHVDHGGGWRGGLRGLGRARSEPDAHSQNRSWLAPFPLGEAWHNKHHAFPPSAIHGMGRREVDFSGMVISALERAGLVWDVQRISPDRQAQKALTLRAAR